MAILLKRFLRGFIGVIVFTHISFSQWQQTPGPRSCFVSPLTSNKGILFAGTGSYGVYYSENSGTTWSPVNAGWPSDKIVERIAAFGNYIYAGTRNGVFRSATNRSEWVPVNAGLPVNAYVMFLEASGTSMYVGIHQYGIYKSIDSGNSWTLLKQETNIRSIAIFGNTIIAGTGYDALLSNDNGVTWKSVNCPSANIFKIRGDTLFAGTNAGLYHSLNHGATWALIDSGMSNIMIYSMEFVGSDMFVGYGYGHAPVIGVFRSGNNGVDWIRVNSGLTDTNIVSLTVIDDTIFAGTGEGVFISTNHGASWKEITSGLPKTVWNASISSMASAGPYIYAGTSRGMCISDNNGASWNTADSGLPPNTSIISLAVNGNTVFAGTSGRGIYSSTITDKIWTPVDSGLPPGVSVSEIAVTDSVIIAGTSQHGMFRSLDNGLHWNAVSSGSTGTAIHAFAIIDSKVFASIGNEGIYLSTDYGTTWTPTSRLHVETPSGFITTVTFLFSNGTDLFAGFPITSGMIKYGGGLYKSTNNGTTWEVTGKTGVTTCMAADGDLLFAGNGNEQPTINRIAMSINGGTSWIDFSSGLLSSFANYLMVRSSYLFLGNSSGVWRRPLSETPVRESRFDLARMVPFDIRSTIMNHSFSLILFSVPQSERIIITIYNLYGHKVNTLVDRYFKTGQHQLSWDTGNLAQGIYIVRLQAGSIRYSKKYQIFR